MNLIIDFEATCLDHKDDQFNNEIIEIGAILTTDTWDYVDEFDMFVKPILNPQLTAFCTILTTIKQSDVDNANDFISVSNSFYRWISKHTNEIPTFCSWGLYDWNQFYKDCKLNDVQFKFVGYVNLKNEVSKQLVIKKRGVLRMLKHLGLEFEGIHHRGIDDCKNILKICQHVNLKI